MVGYFVLADVMRCKHAGERREERSYAIDRTGTSWSLVKVNRVQ
jgi:hypothetical protein